MALLSFRATEINEGPNIVFDVRRGGPDEPPMVRGRDWIIPGKAGRSAKSRVDDYLIIELVGFIKGTGATLTAQQQSWRTNTATLLALMDRTLAAGALVMTAPYYGLTTGTKTISAKCINVIPGEIVSFKFQRWNFELEAIGDPPEWA